MKKINRRSFIKSSVYLGAATGMTGTAMASPGKYLRPDEARVKSTEKTAVVIGSGFGGSVAALRLSEAGIATALVERGQSWTYQGEDTFPTVSNSDGDGRTTWLGETDAFTQSHAVPVYTGLLERVSGDNTDAICAAGLGGGSLVYGGVLLQPAQAAFEQVFPYLDYYEMDSVYYPRVRSYVSGGTIPDHILATDHYRAIRLFMANAAAAGLIVEPCDVGFDWNTIAEEIEGRRIAAAAVGEYIYGCNSNAKNTLDKNYLAAAMHTGHLQILTLHNVVRITQVEGGRYCIQCDVITTGGELLYRHNLYCRYLFMAAGSLNTSKLLLKSKALGDLPGLNDQIGRFWGTNGDELTAIYNADQSSGTIQGGPASVAARDPDNAIKPVTFMHSPASGTGGMQMQLGMSIPDQLGFLSYDLATDQLSIHWPEDAMQNSHLAYMASLQKVTQQSGGMIMGGAQMHVSAVWHPCGGAIMGQACSYLGEVYGQSNMFVVDGSLLPGTAGMANPALTVAANAERIMDKLIPQLDCNRQGPQKHHEGRPG